jgi:hydroxymethylglutaryl-CoA reductase
MEIVSGFSKMTKLEKINWLATQIEISSENNIHEISKFWYKDENEQKKMDDFAENTISNFVLPFGIAPNFLINNKTYAIPMVIEESSVVAAASLAAKFWLTRGGFHSEVIGVKKIGQVHFTWTGSYNGIQTLFKNHKSDLLAKLSAIEENMKKRGGGILSLDLINVTHELENYYQIKIEVDSIDAMGANFINTLLEELASQWKLLVSDACLDGELEVIMSILSNYTPDCLVRSYVECEIEDLGSFSGNLDSLSFAKKFVTAVSIAKNDVSRAVTHNKGIMNGIDSVVIASGNDFRATEACAHAYAARDGVYRSLSHAEITGTKFKFEIVVPLALGTVGGLTSLHPLAKMSLDILGKPNSRELMQIVATVGLAQNFSAVRSLITTGIQKGHMKLHLLNILNQLNANIDEVNIAKEYFSDKTISFTAVRNFLQSKRMNQ